MSELLLDKIFFLKIEMFLAVKFILIDLNL